jgi:hypothetical protein
MDIDLHPESYKHHHLRAVPEKYRHQVDVRTFGTGERIVFLPYTREVFAATQAWTRRVFPALPNPPPTTRPSCYPGRTGGPWLCSTFVLSLFHA